MAAKGKNILFKGIPNNHNYEKVVEIINMDSVGLENISLVRNVIQQKVINPSILEQVPNDGEQYFDQAIPSAPGMNAQFESPRLLLEE